ncbi:MAG TPA: pitrilysin family protein [Phycisphaerae bacterium]|nr:pitrilysin family protein [Phycisphaerae bacterium]
MKHCLKAALVVFLLPISIVAAERRYPFEQIELGNGMKVITLEDFSSPIVAVQVWYHVGARNENPKRQGFAHMFEHMMFRGTDRTNETAHFDNLRRVGGSCNAYTAFDQTVYVQEVPSNQLEMVLWLESERLAFLKIDRKGFDTERKVVEEELRQGHNRPYGRVPEKLLAELYGDHPYGWTPGGQIAHLRSARTQELQEFWDKYYVPNNATLVIVGAVKNADAQKLVKRYFEWIPRCPQPPSPAVPPVTQKKPRLITLAEDKGPLPIVGVAFRTVPEQHRDFLALEMLMGVLGGGESSRLYLDVVKEKKIAQVALAGAFGLEKDGIAGAGGVLLPFGKKKQLMQSIRSHIKRLREEPITADELEKMKNQQRREAVAGSLTAASKAGLLGKYAVLFGDAERINRRLEEIDAVTVEDVHRAAKTYFTDAKRVSVSIEPSAMGVIGSLFGKGEKESDDAPGLKAEDDPPPKRTGPKAAAKRPEGFPETPPTSDPLKDFPLPAFAEKTLANGLKVVVVPNHEVPMVSMMLGVRSGAWTEASPGVAVMAMHMLTKGTKTRESKELAQTLEFNAVSLSGSAGMDTAAVSASSLKTQADLAAELLADVVMNPIFPKDEFDVLLNQEKAGLMISSKTPDYLADREFRRRLYGEHPYARTTTGEIEDLGKITVDGMKAWWGEHLRPENCVLYLAGDIDEAGGFSIAEKHLGAWKVERPFQPPALAEIPAKQPTHIYIVDRPGSVQSQIRVGHRSITRKDPDFFVSRVLGNILGGGFNSRLNKAIRIEKGLTYGARGGFSAQQFSGDFRVSTFTKTPSTAETVQTILTELEKMQAGPPTSGELDDTRSFIVGSFPAERETPEGTVSDLWLIETQNLAKDYLTQLLAGVRNTQSADVLRASGSLIDRDHLVIVVVGEAEKIKADLEQIAPVTVVNAAPDAKTGDESGKSSDD